MGIINHIVNFYNEKINPNFAMYKAGLQMIAKNAFSKNFERGFDIPRGSSVTNPYGQIGSVYKSIKLICDSVTQAKIQFKSYKTESEVFDVQLLALLENPNPLMTWNDFIQALAGFYSLYDEFIIVKTYSEFRRPNDLPLELWAFNPKDFKQEFENLSNGYKELKGWKHINTNTLYSTDEVIFSKGWNPNDLFRGLAPVDVIKKEIDISWSSLIFNKAFFDNSGTPSLSLSTPNALNDTQRERLTEWLNKEFKGASKAFKTILLESGLKAEHLSHSHTDMEFIEQTKYMETSILGIWRVPKNQFSITENLNYATSREQSRIFWEDTIIPILNKIFAALDNGLVQDYNKEIYIEADLSNIPAFKAVYSEKIDQALKLQQLKIPLNDIVEKLELGFKPYPWGNTVYVSFSDVPIQQTLEPKEISSPDEQGKQLTPQVNKSASNEYRIFLRKHEYITTKMKGKVWSFFNEQRKRAISEVSKSVKDYNTKAVKIDINIFKMDWTYEDQILIEKIMPYIAAGIKGGMDYAESFGLQAKNKEIMDMTVSSLVAQQSKKITNINRTIKKQLTDRITDIILEGNKNGLTVNQIQDNIITGVKDIYNMASNRALLIARTETTNAMNSGQYAYYRESGVEYKRWDSNNIGDFREEHYSINGEIVPINKKFSNGLMYPGDPTAPISETANCTCGMSPIIKKDDF